ncbi:exosortase-dependent surface protein XDP1 [Paraglaciecola sp. 25GB23A]|uniref:exosortase-dependent surface protein XDP1 n=1 Tax=Paraglaciecola sp. 25GB23A TaxID=3156068 RepID=UPI0032AFC57E
MKLISILKKACVLASIGFAANATAGTTTWEWQLNAGAGSNGSSNLSSTGTNTDNATTLNADLSAWADTNNRNDEGIESAGFYYYSGNGWGIVNQDEDRNDYPGHAFDNKNEGDGRDYDMALVSFDTSVELTSINFGWIYDDADFTVLAFSGANINTTSRSTWSDVATSGDWITVGNYDANSTGYYSINQGDISQGKISSQYWLVGAYNSIFGHTLNDEGSLGTGAIDAFKIKGFKGNTTTTPPTDVPAPSAFGLLLVGALGIYARRTKKTA